MHDYSHVSYLDNSPGGVLFVIGLMTYLCAFSIMAYQEDGDWKFFMGIIFTGLIAIWLSIQLIYDWGPDYMWRLALTIGGSVALVPASRWWNGLE